VRRLKIIDFPLTALQMAYITGMTRQTFSISLESNYVSKTKRAHISPTIKNSHKIWSQMASL